MLVVVAVGKQPVTQRAEGIAVLIVAALQAGAGFIIAFGVQQADRAQRLQLVMDIAQDFLVTFPCIPQDFPDLQGGETGPQRFETRDGQEMVVDIGWGTGSSQRPELEETVIDDIERLGFVAKTVFSVGLVGFLSLRTSAFGRVRVGTGLVGTRIVNVGCLRVAGGGTALRMQCRCPVKPMSLLNPFGTLAFLSHFIIFFDMGRPWSIKVLGASRHRGLSPLGASG